MGEKAYNKKNLSEKKEKGNYIKQGSVDLLARLAITALNERRLKLTTFEVPTFGEIISSLAIEGSTSVMAKGEIATDLGDFKSVLYDIQTIHSLSRKDRDSEINALSVFTLSDHMNNIALVTSGSFDYGDHAVHIGLNTFDGIKYNPRSITITKADINQLGIQNSSPTIQKQFVSDQALRLLLDELGIDHKNITFKPRRIENHFLELKNKILDDLIRLLKNSNYKIAFVESATAGFLADSLTDLPGGKNKLHSGRVLYNSEEKIKAGVHSWSLSRDNLYSKATALELAQTIIDQEGVNIAIGVTGLLDTPDTRAGFEDKIPGDVYYSIILPDHSPITEKVSIPLGSRLEMKTALMLIIFNQLIAILKEGK